jgi:hypothetical protein
MALHWLPVGPITNDSPLLLVRMLGSAAPLLPGSNRLGLKVDAGGGAANDVPARPMLMPAISEMIVATSAGRESVLFFITVTSS